jgi:hypothetical protein
MASYRFNFFDRLNGWKNAFLEARSGISRAAASGGGRTDGEVRDEGPLYWRRKTTHAQGLWSAPHGRRLP